MLTQDDATEMKAGLNINIYSQHDDEILVHFFLPAQLKAIISIAGYQRTQPVAIENNGTRKLLNFFHYFCTLCWQC